MAYLLWRDKSGQYHCTADACPHRRASLACGHTIDDAIYCPFHRWRIGSDGECRSPSEMRLQIPRLHAYEELDYVWISKANAPRRHTELIPRIPNWKYAGPVRLNMNAPLETVLDDFSENEHLPWVHGGRVVTWKAGHDDKHFVERVLTNASPELQGMKLRRYDRPVAYGRKLLEEKYLRGHRIPPEPAPDKCHSID